MQDKDVAAFFTLNEPGHWRCLLRWAKFLRRNFKTRHHCPTPELAAHRYIFNLRVIWKLTPPDVAGERQAEAARLLQSWESRHEELLERLKAIWEDELPPQKKILSSSAAPEPAPPFTDTAAEAEAEAAIEAKTATGTKRATGAGAEEVKEVGAETAMDAGPKM